jgi:alkanesulfonate monooxygenase SsuD/methylene tetrahydromethanopterin reductase-like flavin-dependent oxidoreductase (luciferase family)
VAVKAIAQFYPTIPTLPGQGREAGRPLGRDRDRYQATLRDWAKIAVHAEELWFWGISTIEHHFHSEGYEIAPAPGAINAWLGAHTKRINIGNNGYPLGTHNAIRVAEETAVLDHLLQGRFWAGMSRGYQSRWTDVLGQHIGAQATLSDGGEIDRKNRRVFEEQVELLLAAWTEPSIAFNGEFTQVPYPFDSGTPYPASDTAARFGAPGEVGDDGTIRRVSVTPAPYQQPHPPVFVASSTSDESIRYCARKGFVVAHFSAPKRTVEFARIYKEQADAIGHPLPLGANQAPVRWPHVTSTPEAFDAALAAYDADIFENFYSKFFTHKMPRDSNTIDNMKNSGLFVGGTVDEACRSFEAEWSEVPYEYSILIWHWAQQPTDDLMREMELMATKVYPAIGGMAPPEESARPQWSREVRTNAQVTL